MMKINTNSALTRVKFFLWRFSTDARASRHTVFVAIIVAVMYYIAALVGLTLHFPSSLVYFIWPPSAVLFVAFVLFPMRDWWILALVVFPAHMLAEWGTIMVPPSTLALFYAPVIAQTAVGAYCVHRLGPRPFHLNTIRALIVLFISAGAAAVTEAFALLAILALTTPGVNPWMTLSQTFLADTLTLLVLAPGLLIGSSVALHLWSTAAAQEPSTALRFGAVWREARAWRRSLPTARIIEAGLLAFGLIGTGLVAFGGYVSLPSVLPALLYTVLPLLLWAAMRFGVGGASLALCGLMLLSIFYAIHNRGPFSALGATENLYSLQLFFIAITIPVLTLAALMRERQDAQEWLEQSEARYRAVVSNFPEGAVLLFDAQLRHVFADGQQTRGNETFERAVVGSSVWNAFPSALSSSLAPRYQSAIAGIPASAEIVYDDHIYYVQTLPVYYRAVSSGTIGMAVIQDVTEGRRAEALAELDRAKTVFFSNVSHEFQTPLTLLLGPAADALADREDPLPPSQRERIALIQRNGLRLSRLVTTLLDFSRLEAGRWQGRFESTDLPALTSDLASEFRAAIEEAGLRLTVDCPPLGDGAQEIYVDRTMWERIVFNLLSNAFKFTSRGEIHLSLHAKETGDTIELKVSDTGTGIPTEELPHLFERFHRIPNPHARVIEGSGIGLAMTQELIHLHGGAIHVASAVGQGSVFTVAIPAGYTHLPSDRVVHTDRRYEADARPISEERSREEVGDGAQKAPEAQRASADSSRHLDQAKMDVNLDARSAAPDTNGMDKGRPRILIADDNADMGAYLARLLSERYEVVVVRDGKAVLDLARARPVDLVLSDVMMPELDGLALIAALRADASTRALPVILLSARSGEEAMVEGLLAGADDYLAKPFSTRELLARVGIHVELSRLRAEAVERAAKLEIIFNAMTDGVLVFDADGRTSELNASAERLFGWAPGVERQRTLDDRVQILHPYDSGGRLLLSEQFPSVRLLRGESLEGAKAVRVLARAPSGAERWLDVTGAPIRDATGMIVGAVSVVRDVTELKQTQEALEAQERLFRTLVENSPDIITRFDRRLRHLYVSPAGEAVTGIPASERLGKSYSELPLPKVLTARWEQAIREVFTTGQAQALETEFWGAEGAVRFSQVRYIPEFAADGSVESVLGLTTDITALKETERALRAANDAAEVARRLEEQRRQEAERREQIAESLREVLAILNSTRPLDEALAIIGLQASRVLGAKAVVLFQNTLGASPLSPHILSGSFAGRAAEPDLALQAQALELAAQDGMALEIRDLPPKQFQPPGAHDAINPGIFSIPRMKGAHALLAAPLVSNKVVDGILALYYAEARIFSSEERQLAFTFGNHAALAIENARLRDEVRQSAAIAERNRLARELHDSVTQSIFAASLISESLPRIRGAQPAAWQEGLDELRRLTSGALAEMRTLLIELRPAALLEKSLGELLRQLAGATTSRLLTPIMVTIIGDSYLAPELRVALYRIAQESLNNIAKHAHATKVTMYLNCQPQRVILRIGDNGCGFDQTEVVADHSGLGTIRERAKEIGAALHISSAVGKGTQIAVRWTGAK